MGLVFKKIDIHIIFRRPMIPSNKKRCNVIFNSICLYTFTAIEYIKNLKGAQLLEDKLSQGDSLQIIDAVELYPNHLPYSQIHKNIQEKKLYQGVFRASRDNFLEGFINVEAFDDPVYHK